MLGAILPGSSFAGSPSASAAAAASADAPQSAGTAQRGDFVSHLVLKGEIEAAESFFVTSPPVSSMWNFTITHLIEEGTVVNPGDLLVEFDGSDLQLKLLDVAKSREEARLQLAQKEADIEGRRQDLLMRRAEALKSKKVAELSVGIDPNLIARSDLEKYRFDYSTAQIDLQKAEERLNTLEATAQADLEVARLNLEKAEIELGRIQRDLDRLSVHADSRGLVLFEEDWSTGRKLQVGDRIFKGQPLLRIPNLDRMVVRTTVHDADVASLRLGQPATVVLDAYPGRQFTGRVESLPEIAKSRSYRSSFKYFQFRVALDDVDVDWMKPGMTARVTLESSVADALTVPRTALKVADDGSAYVLEDGPQPRRIAVRVIDANDTLVRIEGEIEPGMRLAREETTGDGSREREIEWIKVNRSDLDFTVSGSGLLEARKSVLIRPPSLPSFHTFKIARMAPEGIGIKEGDFLVQFDPSDFFTRLRNEQANLARVVKQIEKMDNSFALERKDLDLELEEARAAAEKAESKLVQAKQFQANKDILEATYEAEYARFRVDALEKKRTSKIAGQDLQLNAQKEQQTFYQARVNSIQSAIAALTVTAPNSGVLVYQTNWANEKKKVGDQTYMNETLFTLPDLETLRVAGRIAEADAGKVKLGQPVSVTLDAIPDETFSGRVQEIDTIFKRASQDTDARILQLTIDLEKLDPRRMRPGMAARIAISIESFQQVLAVPLPVIQVEDGQSFVWAKGKDGPEKREVEVGKNNGIVAVITSGLQPGDEVSSRPLG